MLAQSNALEMHLRSVEGFVNQVRAQAEETTWSLRCPEAEHVQAWVTWRLTQDRMSASDTRRASFCETEMMAPLGKQVELRG